MVEVGDDAAIGRAALARDGLWLLDERLDAETCRTLSAVIDGVPDERSEINYGASEKRIWRADREASSISDIADFADRLMSWIAGRPIAHRDVLAIRNRPIPPKPDLLNGRWHLDSLRRQIKIFLFLTDVTERSGPLELIAGTHLPGFRFGNALKGHLISPLNLLGKRRRYQHLDDAWIGRVIAARGTRPIICPAGTIAVVNTSAIHRARPCVEGERYALTVYYDHF